MDREYGKKQEGFWEIYLQLLQVPEYYLVILWLPQWLPLQGLQQHLLYQNHHLLGMGS